MIPLEGTQAMCEWSIGRPKVVSHEPLADCGQSLTFSPLSHYVAPSLRCGFRVVEEYQCLTWLLEVD